MGSFVPYCKFSLMEDHYLSDFFSKDAGFWLKIKCDAFESLWEYQRHTSKLAKAVGADSQCTECL